MLTALNFTGIANALAQRARAPANTEATLELVPEPALPIRTPAITPKRRTFLEPAPRQPSAKEHAQALLDWICANVDLNDGPITHAAIMEFYMEAMIELNWNPRPWNPVAHQFRLLTTGNRRIYMWMRTTTGALHRLRVYPIPGCAAREAAKTKDDGQLRSAA